MTIKEVTNIIENEHTFVIIDSNSCEEVYDEDVFNAMEYPYSKAKYEEKFKRLEDCEVLGIRSQSEKKIALYINAPSRRCETWLSAEYSIRIALDVPYGEDEEEALRKYAEEKLDKLPKIMTFDGDEWTYDYDNIEGGGFYDNIEEY